MVLLALGRIDQTHQNFDFPWKVPLLPGDFQRPLHAFCTAFDDFRVFAPPIGTGRWDQPRGFRGESILCGGLVEVGELDGVAALDGVVTEGAGEESIATRGFDDPLQAFGTFPGGGAIRGVDLGAAGVEEGEEDIDAVLLDGDVEELAGAEVEGEEVLLATEHVHILDLRG